MAFKVNKFTGSLFLEDNINLFLHYYFMLLILNFDMLFSQSTRNYFEYNFKINIIKIDNL